MVPEWSRSSCFLGRWDLVSALPSPRCSRWTLSSNQLAMRVPELLSANLVLGGYFYCKNRVVFRCGLASISYIIKEGRIYEAR
jgi:hypothetical protein